MVRPAVLFCFPLIWARSQTFHSLHATPSLHAAVKPRNTGLQLYLRGIVSTVPAMETEIPLFQHQWAQWGVCFCNAWSANLWRHQGAFHVVPALPPFQSIKNQVPIKSDLCRMWMSWQSSPSLVNWDPAGKNMKSWDFTGGMESQVTWCLEFSCSCKSGVFCCPKSWLQINLGPLLGDHLR